MLNEMSRSERNGNPKRDASRRVSVEEGEVTAVHRIDKQIATGVNRNRKPTVTMSIEIAHDDSVSVGVVEEGVEVGNVARSAG